MSTKTWISTLAAVFVFLTAIFAATHDFVPDFSFQGSSLTGWHSLGPASWRAQNGEIIATPQSRRRRLAGDGQGLSGRRVLHGRCAAPRNAMPASCCERKRRPTAAGRESTSSLSGEGGSYDLTLNADGKELSRTRSAASGRAVRAHGRGPLGERFGARCRASRRRPSRSRNSRKRRQSRRRRPRRPRAEEAAAEARGGFAPPRPELKAGEWNTIDVIVDTDMVTGRH